ncbi:MAG: hypothetical protein NC927_00270 [Candidatus Omnitrophica bacterium]|nr:hypothetical protein [Candidatus Omnitrophota bacterium]
MIVLMPSFAWTEEKDVFYLSSGQKINPDEKIYLYSSEDEDKTFSLLELINKELQIDKKTEKKILREEWKDLLHGLDIFYPYFKTKEIEEWIGEKIKIDFLNFKGKPKLEENEILYIFKKEL